MQDPPEPHRLREFLASFRVRLILLVLVAVLPALAAMLYAAAERRQEAAEAARDNTLRVVELAAADHERLIESTRQILTVLSKGPAVTGGDPAACSEFLVSVGRLYAPLYQGFTVARLDGLITCSSIDIPPDTNVSDRLYFKLAMETGEFAVGEYIISRAVRAVPVLGVAYPVKDAGSRITKLLITGLDLGTLQQQFVSRARLPEGGVFTLVDHQGTVLARYPGTQEFVGQSFPETPLFRAMETAEGEGVLEARGIDGVERVYAFRRLSGSSASGDLYLSVGIPKAVVFGSVERTLVRNLLLLAFATFLALVATWFGGNVFFLRKVRALVRATRRLEAGDLSARTGLPPGRGELDKLAATFDRTAGALEERTTALAEREREALDHLARIARLNRMYAVLSGINGAILRVQTTRELLEGVCRIAVERGKLATSSVHLIDPAAGSLKLAAQAGLGADRLANNGSSGANGLSPLPAQALGEGKVVVAEGGESDPDEWRSAAAIPLRIDDRIVGVLTMYAREPAFFDEEELRLLSDLAGDTALGIRYLETEEKLHYSANYDRLTDLPNRSLFGDRLAQAIALAGQDGKHVGVVSLGIVALERISATWGRAAGDGVVKEIVSYVRGAVREGDTVARIASGELGVVIAGAQDLTEIESLARKLVEDAPASVVIDGQSIFVSLTGGVAVYPEDGDNPDALVQDASVALQSAQPRRVAFFSSDLDAEVERRRLIEGELRKAIEKDELTLYFQPVVDVSARRIVGAEALLRWKSEALGDVSPVDFIGVAEETGLILPVGEWVIETACEQGRQWHRQGLRDLRISFNVSVNQLQQVDFVDRVIERLGGADFDPSLLSLGLEITESLLMENLVEAEAAIRRFRELGVRTYIDDFGIGYSSLSYLRELPIDLVKIDASFVRDMPDDEDAVAVVSGIIAMAHSLELLVIAEGVETEGQFATLSQLGCDMAQGYLFSRPVPAAEFEILLGREVPARAVG